MQGTTLATDVITDYAKRFWYLYRLHSSCITTDRITVKVCLIYVRVAVYGLEIYLVL